MIKKQSIDYEWDDGAAAVEAALSLSVLLLLILGIMELGVALWQWNTMVLAVDEVGRYVMINNATCGATCAETQMLAILTNASSSCANPSSPAVGQICVNAATTTVNSTPSMALTATYAWQLFGVPAPVTLTGGVTVPLD